MKILLDIQEDKVAFVMELLDSLSFVKAQLVSDEEIEVVRDVREAVEELNLMKEGKLKGISAQQLLDEL